jgi:hypothetical protein
VRDPTPRVRNGSFAPIGARVCRDGTATACLIAVGAIWPREPAATQRQRQPSNQRSGAHDVDPAAVLLAPTASSVKAIVDGRRPWRRRRTSARHRDRSGADLIAPHRTNRVGERNAACAPVMLCAAPAAPQVRRRAF